MCPFPTVMSSSLPSNVPSSLRESGPWLACRIVDPAIPAYCSHTRLGYVEPSPCVGVPRGHRFMQAEEAGAELHFGCSLEQVPAALCRAASLERSFKTCNASNI